MEPTTDDHGSVNLQTYLQNSGAYDRTLFSLPEDVQRRVNEHAEAHSFSSADELRAYIRTLLITS